MYCMHKCIHNHNYCIIRTNYVATQSSHYQTKAAKSPWLSVDNYPQNQQQSVPLESHNKCSAVVTSNVGKLFFCLNHIILTLWLYPVSMQSTAFHHYKIEPA